MFRFLLSEFQSHYTLLFFYKHQQISAKAGCCLILGQLFQKISADTTTTFSNQFYFFKSNLLFQIGSTFLNRIYFSKSQSQNLFPFENFTYTILIQSHQTNKQQSNNQSQILMRIVQSCQMLPKID